MLFKSPHSPNQIIFISSTDTSIHPPCTHSSPPSSLSSYSSKAPISPPKRTPSSRSTPINPPAMASPVEAPKTCQTASSPHSTSSPVRKRSSSSGKAKHPTPPSKKYTSPPTSPCSGSRPHWASPHWHFIPANPHGIRISTSGRYPSTPPPSAPRPRCWKNAPASRRSAPASQTTPPDSPNHSAPMPASIIPA